MDELGSPDHSNVNVTLNPSKKAPVDLYDREFACPICGAGLPLRISKRNKPYCTCNVCGIQIFFRGKSGIARLWSMANAGMLISAGTDSAAHAVALLNRLEQLKLQKRELERKLGIIFPDPDVENAIRIVDVEIKTVQVELSKTAHIKQKEIRK